MGAKFSVELTRSAEEDLSGIWDYIAQDNPLAAENFISQIEAGVHSLETMPERCPLIPENEILGTGYRHFVVGAYRAVFGVFGNRFIVLRVLHGSRLIDSAIFDQP